MRILLVSDDADLSVALQILLREEPGCEVVAALKNGAATLPLLRETYSDLVILDWDLRNNSASGTLAAIQKLDRPPRVVAIGKHESDETIALEAGAAKFVSKLESPEHLIGVIRKTGTDIHDELKCSQ